MLSKCDSPDRQISVLNLLLGYPDGLIKDSFFTILSNEEKVPLKNINKKILLDNKINKDTITANINNILLPITIYEDLSHNLRRIYKICMNSLFNSDVLERIKKLQSGGTNGNYNIKSFLYYPNQNHDTHTIKDCGYIQLKYYKNTFLQSLEDTKYILNFCLGSIQNVSDNKSIITSITKLYNFLINNTYNMSEEDLGKKVSLSNNDKLEFNKLNQKFIKCMGDNLSLGIKNFKPDYNKIFDDLTNIDNEIPLTKLEYKQKYLKYKQKYLMLKNKFVN
jgi:flagellin-specific chaperone FliS